MISLFPVLCSNTGASSSNAEVSATDDSTLISAAFAATAGKTSEDTKAAAAVVAALNTNEIALIVFPLEECSIGSLADKRTSHCTMLSSPTLSTARQQNISVVAGGRLSCVDLVLNLQAEFRLVTSCRRDGVTVTIPYSLLPVSQILTEPPRRNARGFGL